jgi:hypothetical protein
LLHREGNSIATDDMPMAALSFHVYLANGSLYIQPMSFNLQLRRLSLKDIRDGREFSSSDTRREGLVVMSLIMLVVLLPCGLKARILPIKQCIDITSEDQTGAWRLLGIDLDNINQSIESSSTIHVSINIGSRELVLEYPTSLILCILELPQLVNTGCNDTLSKNLYSYFPLLDDLSNSFHEFTISDNTCDGRRSVVDYWNYRTVDLWLARETIEDCGKSEGVIVKYEQRVHSLSLQARKGSGVKKSIKGKSPPPAAGNKSKNRYNCGVFLITNQGNSDGYGNPD